jgi:hypothetical protein
MRYGVVLDRRDRTLAAHACRIGGKVRAEGYFLPTRYLSCFFLVWLVLYCTSVQSLVFCLAGWGLGMQRKKKAGGLQVPVPMPSAQCPVPVPVPVQRESSFRSRYTTCLFISACVSVLFCLSALLPPMNIINFHLNSLPDPGPEQCMLL